MGNLTGDVTAQSGMTRVLVIGNITANIAAGSQGSADVTSGAAIQGSISGGQDVSVTAMGNIGGSVAVGGVATVTSLGNESDSITAGSGDVSATANGDDSASVNATVQDVRLQPTTMNWTGHW